jgi:hypothetical protein
MKKYNFKSILIAAGLCLGVFNTQAQVEFKIERMGETNNFMVSAVASESYSNPMNLTSTAQVTLLAPTGDFVMEKIVNLYPDAQWRVNGRTDAPKENPNQDYIYFGLENLGTGALKYQKGKETPLFVIQAKQCASTISLMDNQKDPFMFPNSRQINVGNQITVLGAGGDAFRGNVKGKTEVTCLKTKAATLTASVLRIAPNVASGGNIKVEFFKEENDNEKGELIIFDAAGRATIIQNIDARKGYNSIETDVSILSNGSYFVMLTGVKSNPLTERLVILE